MSETIKDPSLQSAKWQAAYRACIREFPMSEFGRDEARLIAQKFADDLYPNTTENTNETRHPPQHPRG